MENRDYIYLVWQDPSTRRRMVVGKLERGNGYTFTYEQDYEKAMEHGWDMLKSFPEKKVYHSEKMFPAFSSRLPDPKRRDIDTILQEYEIDYYDEYELLKKTGARLPIDSYEFVDPIFPEDEVVVREFYISGVRHSDICDGSECASMQPVNVGDELTLEMEPDNSEDENAVKICTSGGIKVGYIPRYYSEAVTGRLKKGLTYRCKVLDVACEKNCRECLRVELQMPRE